ncbi:class I SAM-dependent methyltransferase [Arthrobacter bambusae]|uniref:class I SAM-dependent methyltransferase n=1 Tax=Arthrobacter bambusae TaxID=1338426 RepID=UPI002782D877|nr:methyltransferase domain-containing protein [Arthrobacter bambusae]MDQ0213117.1 demethylmenaquinone methyltransferase/2-methoxy-6-polyprenyl-1,4-benzoquinol methylase [Arthrobacter bambusae]MDQ0237433.1 demethylmenaquinone methyltransferase/2-methoxy-6-polyprenyl-1,4-benzoquinol methylase [Arthrobacter bambusae]
MADEMAAKAADRYRGLARFYDVLSAEYPVYRAGRRLGIDALGLRTGQRVLDVGCGTGLNFSLLQDRIGPAGTIIGIDRSAAMLEQARHRAAAHGWANIILIQSDLLTLDPGAVRTVIAGSGGAGTAQAALATYSLSLIPDRHAAWNSMVSMLEDGARVSVVDMQDPLGAARWLTPLARFACRLGGSDITAHPWNLVEEYCTGVVSISTRAGHIQVRAGTLRPGS